jgi:hypothetical protein
MPRAGCVFDEGIDLARNDNRVSADYADNPDKKESHKKAQKAQRKSAERDTPKNRMCEASGRDSSHRKYRQ